MWLRKPAFALILIVALAAVPARADIPVPDDLDCAGTYGALSLALPYLPGIFLMFAIAPRSGHAQRQYRRTTPPDQQLPRPAVVAEIERRKRAILDSFNAGAVTLAQITAAAHACDARYGLDPVPVSLDDVFRPD